MMSDPPIPADGTCAQCGGERKHAVPSKYAGDTAVHDPFCSADCCRTFYGVKKESAISPVRRDKWEHGSDSGYRKGCRCEPCVAAHKAACKESYQRKLARMRVQTAGHSHGSHEAYELGCRCASCSRVHGALQKQAA